MQLVNVITEKTNKAMARTQKLESIYVIAQN